MDPLNDDEARFLRSALEGGDRHDAGDWRADPQGHRRDATREASSSSGAAPGVPAAGGRAPALQHRTPSMGRAGHPGPTHAIAPAARPSLTGGAGGGAAGPPGRAAAELRRIGELEQELAGAQQGGGGGGGGTAVAELAEALCRLYNDAAMRLMDGGGEGGALELLQKAQARAFTLNGVGVPLGCSLEGGVASVCNGLSQVRAVWAVPL